MIIAIVDCYTDEPSGLGVPPYLGVHPRYALGAALKHKAQCFYLRIDDLRNTFNKKRGSRQKTDILTLNTTKNRDNVIKILEKASHIIVIAGIQTPGRYLSAVPGTPKEVAGYLKPFRAKKILAGPVASLGAAQFGGSIARTYHSYKGFDYVAKEDAWLTVERIFNPDYRLKYYYKDLQKNALLGASILKQLYQPVVIELESGRGCPRNPGCSFCVEPLKSKLNWRPAEWIIKEAIALKSFGAEYFRLGRQSDLYAYMNFNFNKFKQLLTGISKLSPKSFHIDNVNPTSVITANGKKLTELIVKVCTPGNVAALGVESFDLKVFKANNLNALPEQTLEAIRIINKYGAELGENGMPRYLPGINLLLGLNQETEQTLEKNLNYLKLILNKGWMLRRINIRKVEILPGTEMAKKVRLKFMRKNRKYYHNFTERVRKEIDHEMLKRIAPAGTVLRDVYMEVHDGKHTFGRQLGSYPLIIGVNKRLALRQFYDVKVTGHMLRSITAEPLSKQ